MRTLFLDIADYFKNSITPPDFVNFEAEVGRDDLRVICIEILSWLRRQAIYKHTRGLELNTSIPWAHKLTGLVMNEPMFRDALVVEQNQLRFSPYVSEEERIRIREWGCQVYNPPIIKSEPRKR